MTIIITDRPPRDAWQALVESHPNSNIYQTPTFAAVVQATHGWSLRPLAAVDTQSGAILALWPAVLTAPLAPTAQSSARWLRTALARVALPFASRAVLFGGPLAVPGPAGLDAAAQLILAANRRAWGRFLFSELRHQQDETAWRPLLAAAGFAWEPHLNFLIDLHQPLDVLWNNLSSSARRNVRSAQKKGLVAQTVTDLAGVRVFYDLLCAVYAHARVPLTDISLFEQAFLQLGPPGQFRITLALADGVAIGGRASLLYKDCLLDWYAGADRAAARCYPNDFLVWHLLQWGHAQGYAVFDFGGAGHPDKPYGVRDFKERFGGRTINPGRSVKIHAPWYGLAVKAYDLYRKRFMRL